MALHSSSITSAAFKCGLAHPQITKAAARRRIVSRPNETSKIIC